MEQVTNLASFKKPQDASEWFKEQCARNLWTWAKARAKKSGVPFAIKHFDIPTPEVYEVLGIELVYGGGEGRTLPGSPSLDRIIPELGYVVGNIRTISHRANTLKGNGTIVEFEAVIKYLKEARGW